MKRRNVQIRLEESLADTPAVLLHGARQTGKTTLARAVAASSPDDWSYVTFDDATALAGAHANPQGFVDDLRGNVVLDEIQRAPGLFPALKLSIDRDRRPGRFLMTGSSNVLALPKLSESLAGRMEIVPLWPFSMGEMRGLKEGFVDRLFEDGPPPHAATPPVDVWEGILTGGFPEAAGRANERRRAAWFQSLPRLLELLATRAGALLNLSDVASGLSMPVNTMKRYLALLEATFLVRLLPAWSSNLGLRLIKSPKVYLADTGLICALLKVDGHRLREEGRIKGPLLENFTVMELTKQASWSAAMPSLFHFRTASKVEVDLVLEGPGGRIAGIEIKAAASVNAGDFGGLRKLREVAESRFHRGIVLYTGHETVPFGENMHAVPVQALWSSGAGS